MSIPFIFSIVFIYAIIVFFTCSGIDLKKMFYIPLIFIIIIILNLNKVILDGVYPNVIAPLASVDTIYSEGYTDGKFLKIKIGMTENEVISILGKPQEIRDDMIGNKIHRSYFYSKPLVENFRHRSIVFVNGKVDEILSFIYVD